LTETAARLSLGSSWYNVIFTAVVRWLEMRELPTDLQGLKPQRRRLQPPRWFTADEVRRLFTQVQDLRYLLAFRVVLATGLRMGELLALTLADLGREEPLIRVRAGKGGDGRWVRFPGSLRACMRAYWQTWRPTGVFFERRPGVDPRPLCPHTLNQALRRAALVAGFDLNQRISLHRLRHTFAHEMLLAGIDVVSLQQELGHRCLQSTLRYVTPDLRRSPLLDLDLLVRLGVDQ
jgi:integrase